MTEDTEFKIFNLAFENIPRMQFLVSHYKSNTVENFFKKKKGSISKPFLECPKHKKLCHQHSRNPKYRSQLDTVLKSQPLNHCSRKLVRKTCFQTTLFISCLKNNNTEYHVQKILRVFLNMGL